MPGFGPDPTSRLGGKRTNVRLIGSVSSRLLAYASLAGLALLGGLAFGRLELTVLAVPFLLAIVVGALLTSEHDVRVSMAVDRTRLLEGEQAIVDLTLWTPQRDPAPRVGSESIEVTLDLPPGVALVGRPIQRVRVPAGEPAALRFTVRCARWGLYDVGRIRLRWRDPLWLYTQEGSVDQPLTIRVYPRPEVLRAIVRPAETQVYAGNQVARTRGDGIEFAEIREFVSGDRV
ncbi:MAG: hypothetical protein E6I70_15505, partial [Chloroflexi bacterium]